jgi:hypothetical protein
MFNHCDYERGSAYGAHRIQLVVRADTVRYHSRLCPTGAGAANRNSVGSALPRTAGVPLNFIR